MNQREETQVVGEKESIVSGGLEGLLFWLDGQGFGVSTYVAFRAHALELGQADAEHAATGRLLADLAQQFVDSYDSIPLPIDVAASALARLRHHVAALAAARGADETLTLLNEIASERLDSWHTMMAPGHTESAVVTV